MLYGAVGLAWDGVAWRSVWGRASIVWGRAFGPLEPTPHPLGRFFFCRDGKAWDDACILGLATQCCMSPLFLLVLDSAASLKPTLGLPFKESGQFAAQVLRIPSDVRGYHR